MRYGALVEEANLSPLKEAKPCVTPLHAASTQYGNEVHLDACAKETHREIELDQILDVVPLLLPLLLRSSRVSCADRLHAAAQIQCQKLMLLPLLLRSSRVSCADRLHAAAQIQCQKLMCYRRV